MPHDCGGECIHASRLRHVIAALRVYPNLDVPGDPEATRLVAYIDQQFADLESVADEANRLQTRVAELEAALNATLAPSPPAGR